VLQQRFDVKLAQCPVLTPALLQMVGVLALNNLELKSLIDSELVENPVLEEVEATHESLDERAERECEREQGLADTVIEVERPTEDPFEEIDFGSYFRDFLDPGFRSPSTFEEYDRPSLESLLVDSCSLSDHLLWQLVALNLPAVVRAAAELMIGNLDENGYLRASEEDLLTLGQNRLWHSEAEAISILQKARQVMRSLEPVGIGARDLQECLLMQVGEARTSGTKAARGTAEPPPVRWDIADLIIRAHLSLLERKDMRQLVRVCRCSAEEVQRAVEAIRQLDPRPGRRYQPADLRMIEPDVSIERREGEFVVVMNDESLPSLRLHQGYVRMMKERTEAPEVRDYVKERYRSAIQLLRNVEQRKTTILSTCQAIVRRQRDFLERGVEGLRPMMLKEVAEEIGVHPSTVSRAVANKYVHTQQGVFELKLFFSESVSGPGGRDVPLALLKRRVKMLIESEDPRKPLTDEALCAVLQHQGIQVQRRTIAKYREKMGIPSKHQRRRSQMFLAVA
jgi:RNA polymerase sigma-54 factor